MQVLSHGKANVEEGPEKKSCAIVVTYNQVPNLDQLNSALSEHSLDGAIIIDNSNSFSILEGIRSQFIADHIKKYYLIENGKNLGISKAINIGIKKAIEEGYYFFFLLDDDAIVSSVFFKIERETFEGLLNKGEKVGAVCPTVSNNINQMDGIIRNYPSVEITRAITSGLLISKNTVKTVGLYNEDLFLSWADIEFTERVSNAGLKIFRINQVLICQPFGETVKNRKLSLFPYSLVWKLVNRVHYNAGSDNEVYFYTGLYKPERFSGMTDGQITYIYIIEKNYIVRFIRSVNATMFWTIYGILLFIGTGNEKYIKAIGVSMGKWLRKVF